MNTLSFTSLEFPNDTRAQRCIATASSTLPLRFGLQTQDRNKYYIQLLIVLLRFALYDTLIHLTRVESENNTKDW